MTPDATGTKIRIEGCVLDGDGMPINDAMIEIWQADAQGRYAHPADSRARPNAKFMGFGRSATDKNGVYTFDTIKPGSVPGPNSNAGERAQPAAGYVLLASIAGLNMSQSVEFFEKQFQRQVKEGAFELNPFERLALEHVNGPVWTWAAGWVICALRPRAAVAGLPLSTRVRRPLRGFGLPHNKKTYLSRRWRAMPLISRFSRTTTRSSRSAC